MNLKDRFNEICCDYVDRFCRKHEFNPKDVSWVNIGGIVSIADYFFSFDNIRYDIDNRVNKSMMIEFYDYSLDKYSQGINCPNYENYIKGAR